LDLRGNGRPDLVLGNLGLNSYLRASRKEPARLSINDFSHSGGGNLEQVLTFYRNGVSYPVAGRDELVRKIPSLSRKYPTYSSFGASRVEDIFPASDLKSAQVREVYTLASAIARNNGNGTFTLERMPIEAQVSPIYTSLADDFDGDGRTDLLVAGNFYGVPPVFGRYDASYGLMMRGNAEGRLVPVDMDESNLVIEGQVRHLKMLKGPNGERLIAVARNNDTVEILRVNSARRKE